MELECLQRRHRYELEKFQQHQLQLLIQQQQHQQQQQQQKQASSLDQNQHQPLLYHAEGTPVSGRSRPTAIEDFGMFRTPSHATSLRLTSLYSLDTDETLRLATQILDQAPQSSQRRPPVEQNNVGSQYAMDFPRADSSQNALTITGTTTSSQVLNEKAFYNEDPMNIRSQEQNLYASNSSNLTTAPRKSESPTSTDNPRLSSPASVTLTSSSTSTHCDTLVQNQETMSEIVNTYATYMKFPLSPGCDVVYTSTGESQSQLVTPATPEPGDSSAGTPNSEFHYFETTDTQPASSQTE